MEFEVDGELFTAHRYVLAARSSVFMAELFGPMEPKATDLGHLRIPRHGGQGVQVHAPLHGNRCAGHSSDGSASSRGGGPVRPSEAEVDLRRHAAQLR